MRNKVVICALVIGFLPSIFSVDIRAQDATVLFNDVGISIGFKATKVSGVSPKNYPLDENFYSQMYVEKNENKTLHRVLSDRESGLYFGYDLKVDFDPGTRKSILSVKPLSIKPNAERELKDLALGSLPSYPDVMLVGDGDTIRLDILEEPRTKVKIVDIIKINIISLNKTIPMNNGSVPIRSAAQPVGDFKPEMFQNLRLTYIKILINGTEVADPGSLIAPIVYFYIPEKGRFILSLVPHPGYSFQKIGSVENNEISFAFKGDEYKLVSSTPILAAGGRWNVWVLYDPDFRPDPAFSAFSPFWMGAGSSVKDFFKKNEE